MEKSMNSQTQRIKGAGKREALGSVGEATASSVV